MTLAWRAAGATDVGRVRQGNEDAFLVDAPRGVFLVADGMGGHAAGEVASAMATERVGGTLARCVDAGADADTLAAALDESIRAAHADILERAASDPATTGMGTTLTALAVGRDGTYRLGHVGDSRMYLFREGVLTQVTTDHTWVQREVDAGRLTPAAARRHPLSHILTRALGADSADVPVVLAGTLQPGDRVLLCTDGLTGMLTDEMVRAFVEQPVPAERVVAMLLAAANRRGGRDNITAVVVDVTG